MKNAISTATSLTELSARMASLDQIAGESMLLATSGNPFTAAVQMAQSIKQIREALTDEVMVEFIMPLMNSKLGFRTDKDPNRPVWNPQSKRMVAPDPYTIEVVRECYIEATLRGVPSVGNCWNIISGQSYVTKEGFWFLIGKRVEGLTDFKISVGVPKMIKAAGDARNANDEEAKGAIVACFAMWKLNGIADRVEREIPIRVNGKMGADAIMGKAERKILAAAYAQITGTTLGDADATEVDHSEMRSANAAPKTGPQGNPYGDFNEPEAEAAPTEGAPNEPAPEAPADEFVPAQCLDDIRSIYANAEISQATFEGKLRKVNLLSTAESLSVKLSKERLQAILASAEAVIAGTYSAE